jgi:hypothetical protein
MVHNIASNVLTRDSSVLQHFSVEASDIHLRPGQWPEAIVSVGTLPHTRGELADVVFDLYRVESDGTHRYHQRGGEAVLRVFND